MRKITEVLRLRFDHQMSNCQIAKSCSLSHSTVRDYLNRVRLAGLPWPLDPALDNATLENMPFPEKALPPSSERGMPRMGYLFRELNKRKRGTLHSF